MKTAVRRSVVAALAAIAGIAASIFTSVEAGQETATPQPQSRKGVVIRGCLTGSKLTHLDPQNLEPPTLALKLPDTLRVSSIRVIRNQVKALNGHQVEITGALRSIPGMETGLLVGDSDNARLYIGGADPSLGSDLYVARNEPPTIYAQMIKDVADTCLHQSK
jgi:hypothetical protein